MTTATRRKTREQVTERPQQSFDEQTLNDSDLEALLESRTKAKEAADAPQKEAHKAHEAAKSYILGLGLDPGSYRIGRHVVTVAHEEGSKREFFVKPSTQISFKLLREKA